MKPSYTTEEKDGYEIRTYDNGSKEWYKNGNRHREDGPAYEGADGRKGWYLEGVPYSEDEWGAHPLVKKHHLLKKINELQDRI